MTSPGFEGKGIFSSLALDLYDRVANDPGVTGVMGFPNQKSHYALVKKIHWKDLNILTNFSISGTKAGMREVPGMQLISRFDQRHADFIHQAISDLGFSVFVNRSAAYLNWRYLDCPVQDYDCFEYISNNEIKGIIVTKSFDSFQHAGHKEADILEIFCAPQEDVIKDLLAGAGYFYDKHRATNDCLAAIELLATPLPASGIFGMQRLLKSARQPTWRIWAENSPSDRKDILKARGYRWNPDGTPFPKA